MAAFVELAECCGVAHCLCCLCDRAIGDCVFHVVGDCLVHEVAWDVSVFFAKSASTGCVGGCCKQGLVCAFAVNAREALDDSVGYGDDSGVAYHAVGLVAPEMPYRQASLLAAYVDHGVYHVGAARLGWMMPRKGISARYVSQRENMVYASWPLLVYTFPSAPRYSPVTSLNVAGTIIA